MLKIYIIIIDTIHQGFLFLPHPPMPPAQYPIDLIALHLRPNHGPGLALPSSLPLLRLPLAVPQHLSHLLFSSFLFLGFEPLHYRLHRVLFALLLVRRTVPPLLQLLGGRLFEPTLDFWVALETLEDVLLSRKERGAESGDSELEDVDGCDDEDQGEPPGEATPEGVEEGRADVVDGGAGGVACGEDDVPEEPATNGDYERGGVGRGLGVGLDESGGNRSV